MEERLLAIEKGVRDLCILINTEYSSLGVDKPFGLELEEVIKLDSLQALQLVSSTINELVQAKQDMQNSEEYQEYLDHEVYQKALQKLEKEVRGHIKVEQQLKIYIESLQAKVEESEKAEKEFSERSEEIIRKLKQENLKIQQQIKHKEQMTSPINERSTITSLRSSVKKETSKLSEIEKKNNRLAQESKAIQSLLAVKKNECQRLKRDNKKYQTALFSQKSTNEEEAALIEFYKRKYEEKINELQNLKGKLKRIQGHEGPLKSVSPGPSKTKEEHKPMSSSRSNSNIKRTSSAQRLRRDKSNPKPRLPMNYTINLNK